jgi:hypothetical protein
LLSSTRTTLGCKRTGTVRSRSGDTFEPRSSRSTMDNDPRPPVVICRWKDIEHSILLKLLLSLDQAMIRRRPRRPDLSPPTTLVPTPSTPISRPPSAFEPLATASAAVEEAAAGDNGCVRELQLVSRGAPSSVRRQRRCVRLRLGQALVPVPGVLLALPLYALLFDVVVPTSSVTLRLDFRRSQRSKTSITCETGMLSCRAGRQSGRRSQSLVVPP